MPVVLERLRWAEEVDSGVDLGVEVLSKPAKSSWVAGRAWLRW